MCFPIDIEVARDAHVQRARTLETRNRLALRDNDLRRAVQTCRGPA